MLFIFGHRFWCCPNHVTLLGVYTFRSYDRPVGPTIGTCKHPVRLTVRVTDALAEVALSRYTVCEEI